MLNIILIAFGIFLIGWIGFEIGVSYWDKHSGEKFPKGIY